LKFIADLHIHSRYSIATSKSLDFENLYIAAQLKGIGVVGTGDITHPKWFSEANNKLIPAGGGLYKLRDDIARCCDLDLPPSCRSEVRFLLTTEISNIYKKAGKTRKNHNLAFFPDIETAGRFNRRLDRIGNIKSDGRPILGLDARNLLEILLEVSDLAFLVPAHIWTPWFSVLGSKSGFGSIQECFEDLSGHIFAVETGLSSDPEMNWQVSGLDGLTLISNSDAHSPMKLGREANIFDTDLSFTAIKSALEKGDPNRFLGTFEFFPQEGKYHMDGHRSCRVRFNPSETMAAGGICPVCEKQLTRGVLNRVRELSDRKAGEKPKKTFPFHSIVPLTDIISEIYNVGSGSKKVLHHYKNALGILGSELDILHRLTADQIEKAGIPLLAEAVVRMREKKIEISPGYDGEFGKIKIFAPGEREELSGQKKLFYFSPSKSEHAPQSPQKWQTYRKIKDREKKKSLIKKKVKKEKIVLKSCRQDDPGKKADSSVANGSMLNKEQLSAVEYSGGPLMIVAGPGTGKTLTLTHRIGRLIRLNPSISEHILAVTFTNRAAVEMNKRLQRILGPSSHLPFVSTFHAFCLKLLRDEIGEEGFFIIDEKNRESVIADAVKQVESSDSPVSIPRNKLSEWIGQTKLKVMEPESFSKWMENNRQKEIYAKIYHTYQEMMKIQKLYDYDDLIKKVVKRLESDKDYRGFIRNRFRYLFVDEYQDLNEGQYRIVRALAPPEGDICVIGDPDQSIYGFRGSDVAYFKKFITDYPGAKVVHLTRNYRSTETILKASGQVMNQHSLTKTGKRVYSKIKGLENIGIIETVSGKSEAVAIGKIIEKRVGGTGFYTMDFGRIDGYEETENRDFSDFAVLCRTGVQIREFTDCFEKAGIPYRIAAREKRFGLKEIVELLSVFNLVRGFGSFMDVEKAAKALMPKLKKEAIECLKMWCYDKKIDPYLALKKIRRFPVPGMKKKDQHHLVTMSGKIDDIYMNVEGLNINGTLMRISEQIQLPVKSEMDDKTGETFHQLLDFSKRFNNDTAGFLASIKLDTEADIYESGAGKVTLITLHASKGLEFPVVFIAGCEDGYLPYNRPGEAPSCPDEERRLLFVAITRAKEELYLTYSKKRQIWGKTLEREISPYINDIHTGIIKTIKPEIRKKKMEQVQLALF